MSDAIETPPPEPIKLAKPAKKATRPRQSARQRDVPTVTEHDEDLDGPGDLDVEEERANLRADGIPEEQWPAPLREDRITPDDAVGMLRATLTESDVDRLLAAAHAMFQAGIPVTPQNEAAVNEFKAVLYRHRHRGG